MKRRIQSHGLHIALKSLSKFRVRSEQDPVREQSRSGCRRHAEKSHGAVTRAQFTNTDLYLQHKEALKLEMKPVCVN